MSNEKVAPIKRKHREHVKCQKVSTEEIKTALLANTGIECLAAKWLSDVKTEQKKAEYELLGIPFDEKKDKIRISRQAIHKRILRNAELVGIVEDLEETKLDIAEKYLFDLMKGGSLGAVCFYLKCKGKKRGYVERQEFTGADGDSLAPMTMNVSFVDNAGDEGSKT